MVRPPKLFCKFRRRPLTSTQEITGSSRGGLLTHHWPEIQPLSGRYQLWRSAVPRAAHKLRGRERRLFQRLGSACASRARDSSSTKHSSMFRQVDGSERRNPEQVLLPAAGSSRLDCSPLKSERVYSSRILARSAREMSRCAARARSLRASTVRSAVRADPCGTRPCTAWREMQVIQGPREAHSGTLAHTNPRSERPRCDAR